MSTFAFPALEKAPEKFALTLGGKRGKDVQVLGMWKTRNCFPPTLARTSGRGVFSTAGVFFASFFFKKKEGRL